MDPSRPWSLKMNANRPVTTVIAGRAAREGQEEWPGGDPLNNTISFAKTCLEPL